MGYLSPLGHKKINGRIMLDTCVEVAMSDNFNRPKSLNIFLVGYTSNNFHVAIIVSYPR
jgi:hypothetical protein